MRAALARAHDWLRAIDPDAVVFWLTLAIAGPLVFGGFAR